MPLPQEASAPVCSGDTPRRGAAVTEAGRRREKESKKEGRKEGREEEREGGEERRTGGQRGSPHACFKAGAPAEPCFEKSGCKNLGYSAYFKRRG